MLRGEEEIEAATALHERFPQARVALDMAKVKKSHPLYRQYGLGACGDAAAMQALVPSWTCNPERPAFDRWQGAAGGLARLHLWKHKGLRNRRFCG